MKAFCLWRHAKEQRTAFLPFHSTHALSRVAIELDNDMARCHHTAVFFPFYFLISTNSFRWWNKRIFTTVYLASQVAACAQSLSARCEWLWPMDSSRVTFSRSKFVFIFDAYQRLDLVSAYVRMFARCCLLLFYWSIQESCGFFLLTCCQALVLLHKLTALLFSFHPIVAWVYRQR